jgi:hypothetical protein
MSDTQTINLDDNPIEATMSINGDMTGILTVNENSGLVIKGSTEGIISGEMGMTMIPGQDPLSVPIEISIAVITQMTKVD